TVRTGNIFEITDQLVARAWEAWHKVVLSIGILRCRLTSKPLRRSGVGWFPFRREGSRRLLVVLLVPFSLGDFLHITFTLVFFVCRDSDPWSFFLAYVRQSPSIFCRGRLSAVSSSVPLRLTVFSACWWDSCSSFSSCLGADAIIVDSR
ncbi:unnamed protein product, partial [Ectocarpus sp. 6 AP-2014]